MPQDPKQKKPLPEQPASKPENREKDEGSTAATPGQRDRMPEQREVNDVRERGGQQPRGFDQKRGDATKQDTETDGSE